MVAHSFDPQALGWQRLEALCVSLQPVWSIYQALEQPRLHRDTLRLNKIMVTLTAGCRGLDCPVWGATVHFTVLGSRGKQWGRNWGFKFDALGCPCPLCVHHHLHKHICWASLIQNAWDQSVPDLCIHKIRFGNTAWMLLVEHFWAPKLKCSWKSKLFFGVGPQVQEAWGTTQLPS